MPNYVGSDLAVRFESQVDGEPSVPESVKVLVYGPDNKCLIEDRVIAKTADVTYVLKKKHVLIPGFYTFDFWVTLPEFGEHEHRITAEVRNRKRLPTKDLSVVK
jgi:hypothetical protein